MIEVLTGINIKTIPYSESSIILQIFSKEKGKISLLAKGVKKSKTGNIAKLNTFCLNKYHVRKNKEKSLKTILIIENIKPYDKLLIEYQRLQTAYQVIWAVNNIAQENHCSEELFSLTEETLDILENSNEKDLPAILLNFKKKLLICEGVLNPFEKNINIEQTLENYMGKQMIKL